MIDGEPQPPPSLVQTLRSASIAPAILVAIHLVISRGFNGYDRYPPLDIPMHFLGGVVITCSGAVLLRHARGRGWIGTSTRLMTCLLLFLFATTAAVVWEFVEFLADAWFLAGAQRSLPDTMGDMLMGMLGALAAAPFITRSRASRPS